MVMRQLLPLQKYMPSPGVDGSRWSGSVWPAVTSGSHELAHFATLTSFE
jgi:hypothetical protein